jgi:nucleoside-diphosphate-sugar epimerase
VGGDLRDPEFARTAAGGSDAIVHLAAHPQCWEQERDDGETLDACARGTYMLLTEAARAGIGRVVLCSTLDVMEAYPPGWRVDETWRPRPSSAIHELAPYVAELSARELASDLPLLVICLRLGRLVGDEVLGRPPDSRALHVADAARAIASALAFTPDAGARLQPGSGAPGRTPGHGWWVFHVPGGRRARFPLAAAASPAFGYTPEHDFGGAPTAPEPRAATVAAHGALVPAEPVASRPIRRVAVFGGCGPLAAATVPLLAPSYTLRVTDVLAPEAGAARIAQRFPSAFRPGTLPPPHEFRRVDVSEGDAVRATAEEMDALVNCTVLREEVVAAFRVNVLGAYNVVRAAVACGIRRVVHTGPQILNFGHPAGYGADFDVPDEAPPRPGANVYFHTKYLAYEICRTFAQNHGLEVAALLFSNFVSPAAAPAPSGRLGPATVSWEDAGHAMRRAVEVPALPSPFEAMRIIGDMPHGRFGNQKARRILGWAPRDSLLARWGDDAVMMA